MTFKCFLLTAASALPWSVLASVPVMPEHGEIDSGLHVTLITSLHTSGPDVPDELGMPKGWPAASYPMGAPLRVSGDNGDFVYFQAQRGAIVRVAPVPSQYQTEIPYPLYKSGANSDPIRHRGDVIGNLVQRANGDLVGAMYASSTSTRVDAIDQGALYRTDFDGSHGTLIESTLGQLIHPLGVLVADGDRVYGVDLGEDGNGRIFRLNADDSLEFLYRFGPGPDGRRQLPNGFTLGSDGALYGVTAYDRGLSFAADTPTDLSTASGAIYRFVPDRPDSFSVLRTLTLAEGEIVTAHPGANRIGVTGSVNALNWVVEGSDGWLYGTTAIGQCEMPSANSNNNALGRHHPLCGFKWDADHWLAPEFPYYDVPATVFGAVYRIRVDGSQFQVLHRFNYDDGASPRGPLAVGEDGAIYGTTLSGGLHESVTSPAAFSSSPQAWHEGRWVAAGNNAYPINCEPTDGDYRCEQYSRDGVLYRIDPQQIQTDTQGAVLNGGFQLIHHFRRAQSGKTPLGVVRGGDGRLYGTTGYGGGPWIDARGNEHYADSYGTLFVLGAISQASVTLTVHPAEAMPGDTVALTWTSHQARDCAATSSSADWSGAQQTQGSVDLTQSVSGVYTYGLTCIDIATGATVASGVQTLRIGATATETDGNTVRYGGGGAVTLYLLLAICGLAGLRFASPHRY